MKKLLHLLMLLSVLFGQVAYASEHNTDPTFANTSFFTLHTGWSYGANKLTGTSVQAQRAEHLDSGIIKGHTYKYSITVANWTAGSVQVMLGAPKGASSGSYVFATDTNGATPIPDNFTSTDGVIDVAYPGVDSSADPNGSFRFDGTYGKLLADDPMVYPGQPGASHLHIFYGNTGVNAYSTYQSLRTSGGTSLGNPAAPLNRTAYWTPAMLDGEGNVVVPMWVKFYYKRIPTSNSACVPVGGTYTIDTTHVGICVPIPNGLRYVWGYNMGTMTGGPTGGDSMRFECMDAAQLPKTYNGKTNWPTLKAMVTDVNASGGTCPIVYSLMEGPNCWDGVHLDTPNHRDHVRNNDGNGTPVTVNWTYNGVAQGPGQWIRCPLSHPYLIPNFSMQQYYHDNPAFYAGKWRLSSDEQMSPAVDAGTTLHMDYWEAWSPYAKNLWETHCENEHMTCADGALGAPDGMGIPDSNFSSQAISKNWTVSLTKFGFSRPWKGNGTFTGEITAVDGGEFALYSPDGFTGDVTALSITDVTKSTTYTPITVHGSN